MATESSESKSWLTEMFDSIKNIANEISNFFSEVTNTLKSKLNERFWKEIFKVETQTKKDLKNLADEVLKLDDNKLKDKEISENEKKILDKLLWNEKIKKFFEWLSDDSISEEILNDEKEKLLKVVKTISNNDSDSKKSDLTETEINNLASSYESKLKVLNSVLDDENIKNKDPKVTKKQVLENYNKLKEPTKENIIAEINKSTESSES